ncbi:hypothetical protein Pmani_026071 [Petrolisthes manimaculis]|uniref:ENTH domain-containing protein n=1 Tax=Petrolisthes manimaculis TaxID=1843537 RepID=A0AAE1U0H2_9EUCA|nr:hypothetical protein Pmani_026071 [Petrolisthes manimaculis]
MNVSGLRRNLKNIAHNYTDAQIKVREATSNDPWGPSSTLMSEVADLTYNVVAFTEIMQMIWKRLNDHGRNWRHVYKALVLLEYLIKTGSEKVTDQCKDHIFIIETLKDFQYVEENKDQGMNVREKAKALATLLKDDERLRNERVRALKAKERFAQSVSGIGSDSDISSPTSPSYHDTYVTSNSRPNERNAYGVKEGPSGLEPQLEAARPQTVGEEELQLQLALAMSKEEAEQEEQKKRSDDVRLQMAITQSEEDFSGANGGGVRSASTPPTSSGLDPWGMPSASNNTASPHHTQTKNLPGAEFPPPPVPPFPSHSSALTHANKNTDYASLNTVGFVPPYQKPASASSNPFCDEVNAFPSFTPQSASADTLPSVSSNHNVSAISLPRPASLFISSPSEESRHHRVGASSRYSLTPLSSAALLSSLQAYSSSTSPVASSSSAIIGTTSSTFLSDSHSYSTSSATAFTLTSSPTAFLSPLHSSPSSNTATSTTIALTTENTRHSCPVPSSFNPWHSVQVNTTTGTTSVPLSSSVKTDPWGMALPNGGSETPKQSDPWGSPVSGPPSRVTSPPTTDPWAPARSPEPPMAGICGNDPWAVLSGGAPSKSVTPPATGNDPWEPVASKAARDPFAPLSPTNNGDVDEFSALSIRDKPSNSNGSPDIFECSGLTGSLSELSDVPPQKSKSPAAFLGENSNLVNLDNLVSAKQLPASLGTTSMTSMHSSNSSFTNNLNNNHNNNNNNNNNNPFATPGLAPSSFTGVNPFSSPSPPNPFQAPKPSMNQLRTTGIGAVGVSGLPPSGVGGHPAGPPATGADPGPWGPAQPSNIGFGVAPNTTIQDENQFFL